MIEGRRRIIAITLGLGLVLAGCALLVPRGPWPSGWSARPTEPIAAFKDAAVPECLSDGSAVLHDQRGPDGAVLVALTEGSDEVCFIARVGPAMSRIFWDSSVPQASPEDGLTVEWSVVASPSAVIGHYPDGTTQVVITTTDGEAIWASMLDGRYAAWWPGDEQLVTIKALAADASTIGTWSAEP